jgi:hypothetical protein
MQRVHILSTLESARRPPRAAPSKLRRQRPGEAAGKWQIKLLIGLMAAGILSLLTAFVLLLLDNGGAKEAQAPLVRPITVDRHNPLAALAMRAPQAEPPSRPPQTALIENVTGETTIGTIAALTDAMPPNAMDAATSPAGARAANEKEKGSEKAIDPTLEKTAAKRRARADKDDDVALLEAVMAHSATRKTVPQTPSVADAFQQCSALAGGAAATCRARVCVQHPTSLACHQDL